MADGLAAPPAAPPSAQADLRQRAARVRSWLLTPGWRAHVMQALGVFLVGVVGAAIGAALAPSTSTLVGPIQAEVSVVPSLSPGVTLLLPPAGQVSFASSLATASISISKLPGATAEMIS